MEVIKDHPFSRVWKEGEFIYKWQPKFLTENEIWCFEKMFLSGFVPMSQRAELEIIRTEYIKDEPPTKATLFFINVELALRALLDNGIRHGDLTRPNVLVRDNRPILLDFSESRLSTDPRADKRPEGDNFWLKRTAQEIVNEYP